jgi:hypothetical protein
LARTPFLLAGGFDEIFLAEQLEDFLHLLDDELFARFSDRHQKLGGIIRLGFARELGEAVHTLLKLLHLRGGVLLLEIDLVGFGHLGRGALGT